MSENEAFIGVPQSRPLPLLPRFGATVAASLQDDSSRSCGWP